VIRTEKPGFLQDVSDFSEYPNCVFAPGNERVHFNLWLSDLDGDGIVDEPQGDDEVELVIEHFEFVPDDG